MVGGIGVGRTTRLFVLSRPSKVKGMNVELNLENTTPAFEIEAVEFTLLRTVVKY